MSLNTRNARLTKTYNKISDILKDRDLASLGDAFINFAYSLALSRRKANPIGTKVKGSLLAEALRKAGLRSYLPSRMTRHSLADAAEALIAYAWLKGYMTLEENLEILEKHDEPIEALQCLLEEIKRRIRLS